MNIDSWSVTVIGGESNHSCFLTIQRKKNLEETIDTEAKIDLMIYKLYELTYDEAMIVDPELEQVISREDY